MIQYLVIAFLLVLWMLWMARRERAAVAADTADRPEPLTADQLPAVVTQEIEVAAAHAEGEVVIVRGRLRRPAAEVYRQLSRELPPATRVHLGAAEGKGAVVVLAPRFAAAHRDRPWLHWLLLALTLVTTTWAGASQQGLDVLRDPASALARGLPYSLGLMVILGIHELGHYLTARRHGIDVTPPFFIPVPFALGTFGAFIQMRSQPESRRALFDVAVAGPLAGLAVAVPALLIGLRSSQLVLALPGQAGAEPGTSVASSLLFAAAAKLVFGGALTLGHSVRLSPLAFAGWLGLLVTALNLLPIGQLDGGHAARAMLGNRGGQALSSVAMWSLLLLGLFVWPGLLSWALIVFFLAGAGTPPGDDLTPLTVGRWALGLLTFALLAALLLPLPHALWPAAGLHCPYL